MADTKFTYYNGEKAVTLGDMDQFMDWLVNEQGAGSDLTVAQAVRAVAFCYRGMQLRVDAVSTLPWEIIKLKESDDADDDTGDEVFDSSSDYKNALGFWASPTDTLARVEGSLTAEGRAYVRKAVNGFGYNKGLQYWNPHTIEPLLDAVNGLTGFRRTVEGAQSREFPVDQVLHWWPADYLVELGPAKKSPVKAALAACGIIANSDAVVEAFFSRGAINAMIFALKGMANKTERDRLKDWFKRTFMRGVKSAFETGVFNADDVKVVDVSAKLDGMTNEVLTKEKREDISVALGIPYSLLLSGSLAGLGSGGVADRDYIMFYTMTIVPEADFLAGVLNEQLLHPMGLHFRFRYSDLDVFSEDEKERMAAFKVAVDAGFKQPIAAWMLGMEIPKEDDVPEHYWDAFEDKPDPLEMAAQFAPSDDTEPEPDSDENEEEDTGAELDKALAQWERKALKRVREGHPEKALEFTSDAIPAVLNASIAGSLEGATTEDDVHSVFRWAGYP